MNITINRLNETDKQTTGEMFLEADGVVITKFHTLELPWKDNQRNISCIPKGEYVAKVHTSPRFGRCLWIQDVPNRSEVLVHRGNYYTDIRGCILIGSGLTDINADGELDVTNSSSSMKKLMSYIDTDEVVITIS